MHVRICADICMDCVHPSHGLCTPSTAPGFCRLDVTMYPRNHVGSAYMVLLTWPLAEAHLPWTHVASSSHASLQLAMSFACLLLHCMTCRTGLYLHSVVADSTPPSTCQQGSPSRTISNTIGVTYQRTNGEIMSDIAEAKL